MNDAPHPRAVTEHETLQFVATRRGRRACRDELQRFVRVSAAPEGYTPAGVYVESDYSVPTVFGGN